jgi:TolB-like protein/DNA-binding winged helix-turn-helix (wHTH) protein/cytochrome c-type biogenesis protein CcmH/NrfG
MRVRPSLREVSFEGRKEQLEPRVMQVLVLLARARGTVVARDELIRRCWEGRIVGEAAITRTIAKLRELSEAGGDPCFRIETIPRVGYRLIPAEAAEATPSSQDPAGIQTDSDDRPGWPRRPILWPIMIGMLAIFGLALIGYRAWISRAPTQATVEPSIAVLPFKNLSSDKDAGYLAAGVQDEILTRLAKIGSLKVISRTSADQYASGAGNLSAIARQLGVANILEGSVQRQGSTVRINVQLIRAAGDDHLWAEDYDRKMDDVLSVESEVADAIAIALAAKVTPVERKEIATQATNDPRAYDLFLRGLVFAHRPDGASIHKAIQLFGDATREDPKFALAWSWLARMQFYIHSGDDLALVRRGEGHAALARALALQPDLPEAQVARGYYLYYGEQNYPDALGELARVHARWPNNAEALEALALIQRRLGNWKDSTANFARLVALDPLIAFHRIQLAEGLARQRDFEGALRVLDIALKIWPDSTPIPAAEADIYQKMGRLDRADNLLKNLYSAPDDDHILGPMEQQFWLQRQYGNGAAFVRGLIAQDRDEPASPSAFLHCMLGEFLRMAGDSKGAREQYSTALASGLRDLGAQPDSVDDLTVLSSIYAGQGNFELALRTINHAVDLLRSSANSLDLINAQTDRARLLARRGARDEAIAEIARLMKLPGDLTPAILRLDADFDVLRGDPRFQRLLKTGAAN